jgi:hypothetical protein
LLPFSCCDPTQIKIGVFLSFILHLYSFFLIWMLCSLDNLLSNCSYLLLYRRVCCGTGKVKVLPVSRFLQEI